MSLSTEQKLLIEARIANSGSSIVVAYLFWFFLWFVSAQRFYLGRTTSAALQILSYFILLGFVWIIVDIFLIPGIVPATRLAPRRIWGLLGFWERLPRSCQITPTAKVAVAEMRHRSNSLYHNASQRISIVDSLCAKSLYLAGDRKTSKVGAARHRVLASSERSSAWPTP